VNKAAAAAELANYILHYIYFRAITAAPGCASTNKTSYS